MGSKVTDQSSLRGNGSKSADSHTDDEQCPEFTPVSELYKNYVLLMLTIVYVFNFVDRQILVVLQESIKADLNLSDTQLGLLSGLSFAIFYVSLGVPIARLADRSNRRNIVGASLIVWSSMTAACGFVQNFYQLLLARIGVGVGEAGGSPPAHAMISDYFTEEKRGTALSIYSVGIYIGIMIGFPLGSWLDGLYGWRVAFISVGIPGVLFSLFFLWTVREPRRTPHARKNASDSGTQLAKREKTSLKSNLVFLLSKRSFVLIALAAGLHAFALYGLGNWLASFMIRIHLPSGGIQASDIGLTIGLTLGIAGAVGSFTGGWLADKMGKSDKGWYAKVPAIGGVVGMPFLLVFYFHPTTYVAMGSLLVGYACLTAFLGPSIAITHSLVPVHMRAFASSILFLALNLIGLGFGPLFVGFISDLLEPSLGVESLRWAMAATIPVSIAAIALFFLASKSIEPDLRTTK